MTNNKLLLAVTCSIAALMSGCSGPVSFNKAVQPILEQSCISCHSASGEGGQKTALLLDSYDNVMKGTRLGPVVVPGSAMSSTLYLVIDHKVDSKIQMPPHHDDKFAEGSGQPLSSEQIEVVKNWIDQGAKNN